MGLCVACGESIFSNWNYILDRQSLNQNVLVFLSMNSNFFGWSASFLCLFILFVAISLLVPLCLFIIYLFVCLSIHLFPFRLFSVQKFCLSSTSSFPSSPSPLPSLSKEDSKLLSLSLLLLLLLLFFNRRMYQIWGQIKNYQFWRQAEQQKNKLEKRFFRKMLELKKQL